MGNKSVSRGIMSVPRSFAPDQFVFLQKLLAYIQELGGNVRGENPQRAVRHAELGRLAGGGREAIVRENALADGSVTARKIADSAVTESKIAQGAVTLEALAPGIAVALVSGEASDGETVTIPGKWLSAPLVGITGIANITGSDLVGAADLRESEKPGVWEFDAAGFFLWFAIGHPAAAGDDEDVEG